MRAVRVADADRDCRPPSIFYSRHTKYYGSISFIGGNYDYLAVCTTAREAAVATLARLPKSVEPKTIFPFIIVSQTGFKHPVEVKLSELDTRTCELFHLEHIRAVLNLPDVQFICSP